MDDTRARADARLEQALVAVGIEDPRPTCRDRLKALRGADPGAFARAVDYFENTLVPAVAGGAEPLGQWLDYARVLAEAAGPGRTVIVDARGRSRPHRGATAPPPRARPEAPPADLFDPAVEAPADARQDATAPAGSAPASASPGEGAPAAELVLFLPTDTRRGVLPLLVPARPSAAQQASLDLLVHGRREP